MRRIASSALPALLAVAAACGGGTSDDATALNADLQRDLAAASAVGVELANGTQGYRPAQVVSAIEQSEHAVPVQRRPVRKPVARPAGASAGESERAPAPQPDVAVDAPVSPEPQQPDAGAADAPSVPVVAPRPAPLPVEYPSEDGGARAGTDRGSGGVSTGPDLGTVIGIIIRGGVAGDDHCIPRRPRSRPRGNGFPLPTGVPIFNPGSVIPPVGGVSLPRTRGRF